MSNQLKINEIKVGEILAITHYVKVETVGYQGQSLIVLDLDHQTKIEVRGPQLIEKTKSADQFHTTEKVGKIAAAEHLVNSRGNPFTVCFEKSSGEERTLRGRLITPEPLLGRSMVEDLDVADNNKLRQVDHRTIKWLIVDGIKYIVK